MDRINALYFGAIAIGAITNCTNSEDTSKPNIILIMADDLGYGDLSIYNKSGYIQTPNIDGLAAEGMLFTDYHCSTAQCSPTRYSFLLIFFNYIV